MTLYSDPQVALAARQRLNVAWDLWETMAIPTFYDPAAVAVLDERLRAGQTWLSQHKGQQDYVKGERLLAKLNAERAAGLADLARWQQREAEFIEAERDYLSIVGNHWQRLSLALLERSSE